MAETYCGKTCLECGYKDTLNCLGCKAGPGKQYGGDCELAKCCRDKGHQECATCGFSGNCGTLRSRDRMPEYRRRRIEDEANRQAAIAKRAPVLGKWLWILFWLFIPSSIASLMTNENVTVLLPRLYIPGLILSAVCSASYGAILLRLTSEEEKYKTAGICSLICGAVNLVIAVISGGAEIPTWTLLISIPASIVSFVGEYNEYTAHSIVLTGVDNDLSDKWSALWKWFIGSFCAMLGSLLVIVISPILGLLVTLAAVIALIVVSILKLVYLYRTANAFRAYMAG